MKNKLKLNLRIWLYAILIFITVFIFIMTYYSGKAEIIPKPVVPVVQEHRWQIRSVDTMKYSRDPSREKLNNKAFDNIIDKQVAQIASMSANFVAIGTPYDEEFNPLLRRWVKAARKHNLNVWFRGNFSGWEGWFGYPRIDRQTHISKTTEFIIKNGDLFEDGDIFTSCPECENGIKIEWGDPSSLKVHRDFLIAEHNAAVEAFKQTGKKVESGYYSMNGDLARVLMDKETTKALGGVVAVDHYVGSTERLARDIRDYAQRSGGKVILGEFGAPIPDLHGDMSEDQQAEWISKAFNELNDIPELIGMNYWVNLGGSTAIFNNDGSKRKAVSIIENNFSKKVLLK